MNYSGCEVWRADRRGGAEKLGLSIDDRLRALWTLTASNLLKMRSIELSFRNGWHAVEALDFVVGDRGERGPCGLEHRSAWDLQVGTMERAAVSGHHNRRYN
jgi:hypothetical protein